MADKPLIVLNFKIYPEAAGRRALVLAQQMAKTKKNGYEIIVVPSLATMKEIADKTTLTVFAQHVDSVPLGAYTGQIAMDELKELGINGSLINHSERKVSLSIIRDTLELARQKKFTLIVCASSLSEVKKIAAMKPAYLAYEPPELIGGNISVCEAQPDVIVKAVELVKSISPITKVLCGAGVNKKEDVGQALLLGAEGVLIGHAAPKAKDPKKFLEELLL